MRIEYSSALLREVHLEAHGGDSSGTLFGIPVEGGFRVVAARVHVRENDPLLAGLKPVSIFAARTRGEVFLTEPDLERLQDHAIALVVVGDDAGFLRARKRWFDAVDSKLRRVSSASARSATETKYSTRPIGCALVFRIADSRVRSFAPSRPNRPDPSCRAWRVPNCLESSAPRLARNYRRRRPHHDFGFAESQERDLSSTFGRRADRIPPRRRRARARAIHRPRRFENRTTNCQTRKRKPLHRERSPRFAGHKWRNWRRVSGACRDNFSR